MTWVVLCCGAAFADQAATVIYASGAIHVLSLDGSRRELARGSSLNAGDTLDTQAATVQLQFRDGATMSLQPGTRFRVDDYRYSGMGGDTPEGDVGFFSLLRGGFRTVTGWLGKKHRSQYRVGGVVATIGIRGTTYTAFLDDDGLKVHTIAGAVEVCNRGGCAIANPGDTLLTKTGEKKPEYVASSARGVANELLQPAPAVVPTGALQTPSQPPSNQPAAATQMAPPVSPQPATATAPATAAPATAPLTGGPLK